MQESDNILKILEETKTAVEKNDTFLIKQLSDRTNNTASRTQDPDNITVAVIVYSLGKILEREQYKNYPGWNKFYKNTLAYIDKLISVLKKNDDAGIKRSLELIRNEINNLSGKLKNYIQDVFRKASINKASKIYEHGISMEATAKLLGITMWELASYAGQRDIDISGNVSNVKDRIKIAEEIFG